VTGLRENQTLLHPLKQRNAKPIFQAQYLPTDSTLSDAQLGSCTGNAHVTGCGFERLQLLY
jgi:hypothetical protein